MVLAWHAVALYADMVNKKRVPDLRPFLTGGTATTGKQTIEQQRAALAVLSATYGTPLKWGGQPEKES